MGGKKKSQEAEESKIVRDEDVTNSLPRHTK